ncbi:MAG: helix-turn-helix transcriptional regulator [Anaerolineales bacterium]|uniref:Helix-turn-helix transcriptional regulator n=1 Tax=Candidatus Desulfolinea nitratireducens TaxID=2841698 RepID=A0A8J6TKC7_9CHLR|nr:helix-turn-helix transcriptional regulator [Candidatus Desulfolinea nitratireducens]MBL6983027.1 helix-turn-helix transcriptional regulator [Anaerolineales bacterium]
MTTRELLFLGLLRHQKMHGYQLNEFIQQDLAVCTDIKKPTAYYLLNKMEARGWITQSSEQIGNRPLRRVYQITPTGEIAFQSMLRESMQEYTPTYFEDDIPLAFLDELTTDEASTYLETRKEQLLSELEIMQNTPVHPGTVQWMLEHRLRHLQAEAAWLDEVLSRLTLMEEE